MSRIAVVVSNPCTSDARVIKMIRVAAEAGHEVQVFATLAPGARPWEVVDGVTFHRLEWRPSQMMLERGLLGLAARWRLAGPAGLLAKVLAQYTKYGLFARQFSDAIAAVKPDLIHAHDLICLPAAMQAAERCGARVVYDAHELEVHRNPPLPFYRKWWVGRIERRYGRRADAVITVGRKVGEVLAHHLGRQDINVVYNAPVMGPSRANLRSDLRLPEGQRLLLYVGKVTIGRGVGEILELLPQLPGVFFAAVGPSDLRTKQGLIKQAERQGLAGRFRILPPVEHTQVTEYIRGADLGIISVEPVTLSYRYCMPNKLFELSFADVPILSNKLDEIEEFIGEIGNGEIVDFEQRGPLQYALYRMCQETERYRQSAPARDRLMKHYSWPAQAAKILAIYDRLLGSRPAAGA